MKNCKPFSIFAARVPTSYPYTNIVVRSFTRDGKRLIVFTSGKPSLFSRVARLLSRLWK